MPRVRTRFPNVFRLGGAVAAGRRRPFVLVFHRALPDLRPAHLAQLRLDLTPDRRRELAGLISYRLSCLSRRFRLLEPIAALTSIAAHLSTHRALTDTQNARDAFLAGPALAQRINLAAILLPYSPVLAHRQPLAISRGYPFVALLNYALAT